MWDNLPSEITDNILHRLPVKTLIKCTSLSKSFLSLITTPAFIYSHIALNPTSHLLLCSFNEENKQESYHIEPDNDDFTGFRNEGFPLPFRYYLGDWFNIVGCVNGVLCLVNDCNFEGMSIVLWNPSVRKYVDVPRPTIDFASTGGYDSACGFGYDSVNDDYKVVRLVDVGPCYGPMKVEVFSLKSGCWRVNGVGPSYPIKRSRRYTPCFLRGSVHWVGSRSHSGCLRPDYENMILKFDVCTESFELMELPSILKISKSKYHRLVELYVQEYNGMLTLINRDYDGEPKNFSVWVMKDYGDVKSWTKFFHLNIADARQYEMPSAFSLRKNGEVIMVKIVYTCIDYFYTAEEAVVLMDPVTHDEIILKEIINAERCAFYLDTYVESMALFKEGKGCEERTPQLESAPSEEKHEMKPVPSKKKHKLNSVPSKRKHKLKFSPMKIAFHYMLKLKSVQRRGKINIDGDKKSEEELKI